jgi:hypothetical protein
MPDTTKANLEQHVDSLVAHLEQENPDLLEVVRGFRQLDRVAYKLGLLEPNESFATQVAWWPLISILGTFSSGKSTFINSLLDRPLQRTGNQAVDDKFTVICYGRELEPRVLPALALDSDPRFPLYNISREIEGVTSGEGQRLDSYLQLKTCNSELLKGKIIIDSPGFDADAQRDETLRITDHILDLSDLVLVFFDARHPEPGAMRDTLEHLVAEPMKRPDFHKFVYILNQVDNAAREDNPEEVFAAWQRALANKGLTAGRFYRIYDLKAARWIADDSMRQRYEAKRAEDMADIVGRIRRLDVERAYRVTGLLASGAARIRDELVARIRAARREWRRRVLRTDAVVYGTLIVAALAISFALGYWQGLRFSPPWGDFVLQRPVLFWAIIIVIVALAVQLHRWSSRWAARGVLARIRADATLGEDVERVAKAFMKNVRSWQPFFMEKPVGWGVLTRRKLDRIATESGEVIRKLNDRYTNPSGDGLADEARVEQPQAAPHQAREVARSDEGEEGMRGTA